MPWFNRKRSNRRNRRDNVLDVKLSAERLRSDRLGFAARSVAVLLGAALVVTLVLRGGQWALNEFVYHNPAFAVTEIEVQTDGIILPEQIRRWAGVKVNDNLFALDLLRVKRDLELVPLIQSVSVERVFPHTVKFRVIEREPVAQVYVPRPRPGGGFDQVVYQVDPAGFVMMPLDRRLTTEPVVQSSDALPVITGIDGVLLQPGRRLEAPQAQAALRLVAEFDRSAMSGLVDVRRIDVSTPEILRVTTGQGSEITFAVSQPELQLRRWRLVHDTGLRYGKAIALLDLSVSNNIPARWIEASAVPQPKSIKSTRTRKKNV
jgi:hypothetical protein